MKSKLMLLVVGLMIVGGCAVKPPILAREDPYLPEQIHMTSALLREQTAIGAPRLTRDAAGLLFVTVPIRAATNQQLHVDYRITFIDANGQVLSQSKWLGPKVLPPNVFDHITVNSMSPQAVDFQLDLRYAE